MVSFLGRTWRLHTLRRVAKGEEIAVSYTELYAARAERHILLGRISATGASADKALFGEHRSLALDGWRCTNQDCLGVVPPGAAGCLRCQTPHPLGPASRVARERPWREAIEKGQQWAHTPGGTRPKGDGKDQEAEAANAARRVLHSVERVLKEHRTRLWPLLARDL